MPDECMVCNGGLSGSEYIVLSERNDDPAAEAQAAKCHTKCFVCKKDGKPIEGPFMVEDGLLVCEEHMENKEKADGKLCAGCEKVIGAGAIMIRALGNTYHDECFVCAKCEKPPTGPDGKSFEFHEDDGRVYCERCFGTNKDDVPADAAEAKKASARKGKRDSWLPNIGEISKLAAGAEAEAAGIAAADEKAAAKAKGKGKGDEAKKKEEESTAPAAAAATRPAAAAATVGAKPAKTKAAEPCATFTLDLSGEFGSCKCGWKQPEHGQKKRPEQSKQPEQPDAKPEKTKAAEPCATFELDMAGVEFGNCKCGWKQPEHNKSKGRLAGAGYNLDSSYTSTAAAESACEKFQLDVTKDFGMCKCGFTRDEHAKSRSAKHNGARSAGRGRLNSMECKKVDGSSAA